MFNVLSGGRAGARFSPPGDVFVLGRHADVELRFDPDADLGVSARHARVQRAGDQWLIEDLGSRNGTFVNGTPIGQPTVLHDGDRITLGQGGPELRFERAGRRGEHTTARIRAAVDRERRRFIVAGAALLVLVLVLSAVVVREIGQGDRWARERAALQATVDSLIATGRQSSASLTGEVGGLQAALSESEQRLQRLRGELERPRENDGQDEEALRRDLIAATAALRRQQLAASLDFGMIQQRVRGAVAMVWVEYTDGERTTGTAFAVRPDGLLLTNRHLLYGAGGDRRPARIAVRFSDSEQTFPARAIGSSTDADLAALQVENILGDVPVIPGFNARPDTLTPGTPLALVGFPLGGELAANAASRRVARPVVSAGLLLGEPRSDVLEVQGLGAAGASGSPILDGQGLVVAVLFGGRKSGGEQVLIGVSARTAAAFLAALPQ